MISIYYFEFEKKYPFNKTARFNYNSISYDLLNYILIFKKNTGNNVKIYKNKFGKPFLKNNPEIFFNISYSKNIIIIAISNVNIGIDIEIKQNLSKDFQKNFHYYEQEVISTSSDIFIPLKYWTLKESYLKYLGVGLSKNLKSFYCVPLDKTKEIFSVNDLEIKNNDIKIKVFNCIPNYFFSLCAQKKDLDNIKIFKIISYSDISLKNL